MENVILAFLYHHVFAENSNYINRKKNEIKREQERAKKLISEFVREIDASCEKGNQSK